MVVELKNTAINVSRIIEVSKVFGGGKFFVMYDNGHSRCFAYDSEDEAHEERKKILDAVSKLAVRAGLE